MGDYYSICLKTCQFEHFLKVEKLKSSHPFVPAVEPETHDPALGNSWRTVGLGHSSALAWKHREAHYLLQAVKWKFCSRGKYFWIKTYCSHLNQIIFFSKWSLFYPLGNSLSILLCAKWRAEMKYSLLLAAELKNIACVAETMNDLSSGDTGSKLV